MKQKYYMKRNMFVLDGRVIYRLILNTYDEQIKKIFFISGLKYVYHEIRKNTDSPLAIFDEPMRIMLISLPDYETCKKLQQILMAVEKNLDSSIWGCKGFFRKKK